MIVVEEEVLTDAVDDEGEALYQEIQLMWKICFAYSGLKQFLYLNRGCLIAALTWFQINLGD